MEEELIAQRDAAIAVTRELQKQLQEQREVVERRALNAERLRSRAEEKLKHLTLERQWERQANRRQINIVIICCVIGSFIGWLLGLMIAMTWHQPILGFLAVIPAMAMGVTVGLAIAKTRAEMEAVRRRRDIKKTMLVSERTDDTVSESTERDSSWMRFGRDTLLASKDIVVSLVKTRSLKPRVFHPIKDE